MSDGATTCDQCGAKVAPNTQFCGDCGALVEGAAVPTTSGTMVGLSDKPLPHVMARSTKPPVGNPAPASNPAPPAGGMPKKTLIGNADMLAGLMAPASPA